MTLKIVLVFISSGAKRSRKVIMEFGQNFLLVVRVKSLWLENLEALLI